MTSKYAKHKNSIKHNWSEWKMIMLIIIFSIAFFMLFFCVIVNSSLANPKKFTLANKYECSITSEDISFDYISELDVLHIELVIENIDSNNTSSVFLNDFRIFAIQGKDQIEECTSQRVDYYESINQNISVALNPGEKIRVALFYYLFYTEDVSLLFFNNDQKIEQTVEIPIVGRNSLETYIESEIERAELRKKQSLKTAELNCIKVYLVDGWYADSQSSVNIKIKNSNNTGEIDIDYDSTMNAEELIKQHAGWLKYSNQIIQMDINNNLYLLIQPNEQSFVLTTNASNGYSIKISGSNTTLDEAWNLIESIEIN